MLFDTWFGLEHYVDYFIELHCDSDSEYSQLQHHLLHLQEINKKQSVDALQCFTSEMSDSHLRQLHWKVC